MKRVVLIIGVVLALAPTALAAAPVPVPSLTPAATAKLWRAEVARARAAPQARLDLACTPSRAVFYAQTDWLRLATKLAQAPSPCSQYFVSVPPLAADKTQARPGQAASIRALGADFHAVDEISYTGWSGWVGAGNGTWYDAGVAARDRMAAAGFDVSAGDTWALNELSSAVRKGTAAARRNALDFLHGLAADGTKGIVFAAGVGQSTPDPSQYKVNLQDWLQDSSFWTEASAYVSDFAPENYGDVRNYAVPGTSPQQRRDALLQYLAHEGTLANAGPASTAAARSVLGQTYVTFGNAAWAWNSAYGWTVGATRDDAGLRLGPGLRSPLVRAARPARPSTASASPGRRATRSACPARISPRRRASLLDRIAAAIRDTSVPSADAGSAACAPAWCTTTLAGAASAPQWQQFATWSPTVPAFTSAPFSATAGTPSGPVTVELQTLGMADNAVADRTLTLASDSQTGAFALASAGPWSPTLTLTIPAGSADVSVFYSDTAAGSPTLTARLDDGSLATQSEQVAAPAAPPPAPAPAPTPAPAPAPAPSTPPATTTTPTTAAPVAVPPAAAAATPAAPPPPAHISSVRTRVAGGHVIVSVAVVAGTSHPSGVRVRIRVRRGARTIALVTRVTTRGGLASWRSAKKLPRGRYVATAAAIR